ncbi:MAG: TrkH family potassium uptake protein [Clostridiales bacterium]|nr:TrkH family potassium uptake protein [Clostridiales bacterium]
MNLKMIRYILGAVMVIIGVFMLASCLVALYYREQVGLIYLGVAAGSILLGALFKWKKPANTTIYLKEGCVATALSWVLMSAIGALPFFISREIPKITDAVFETVSGFTTTGASILTDVEALSKTALFWRSSTHWLGGMGVLVFLLAVLPMTGGSNINLMKAESPGPSVGKLVPKVRRTARILYYIYFALTALETLLLVIGGNTFYEAICTSMATAGTGGFGIYNDSIAGFSVFSKWVIAIFMIMFGVNFNFYYLILMRQFRKALRFEEVQAYLAIVLISSALVILNVRTLYDNVGQNVTDSVFQVASIITTTGFSTTDFNVWPTTSKIILFLLMFIGACAGSTGGGIKVSRFQILVKTILKELGSFIHPRNVKKIQSDGKAVEHETVRSVNVFFITFIIIYSASIFLISLEGYDFETVMSSVAATMNNIGPGFSRVGPASNFYRFTVLSKLVFIFDMLAGRLELFPLLIVVHPTLFKNTVESKILRR